MPDQRKIIILATNNVTHLFTTNASVDAHKINSVNIYANGYQY